MERKRSILLASAVAGASLLGTSTIAGATDADLDPVEETVEETAEIRTPPTLPEQAADAARQAVAAAFARQQIQHPGDFVDDELTGDETDETEEVDEVDEVEDGPKAQNHGAAVSEVARTTEPGPGHGPAVREVARSNKGHQAEKPEQPAAPAPSAEAPQQAEPKERANPQANRQGPPDHAPAHGVDKPKSNSGNANGTS